MRDIENTKVEILALLQLKYRKKLNPNLRKVFWVQQNMETYLELFFFDSDAKIEKLAVTESDFIEDGCGNLIYDSAGNPLTIDFFNPFDNILININKFIYHLDSFSKINLISNLFIEKYEAFIVERENKVIKNSDVTEFEERLLFIKNKIQNLLLEYFLERKLILESNNQLYFYNFIIDLNNLTYDLPQNEYEIIFDNKSDDEESYEIVTIFLSGNELKLTEIFCNYENEIGYDVVSRSIFKVNFKDKNITTNDIEYMELNEFFNNKNNFINNFVNFKIIKT